MAASSSEVKVTVIGDTDGLLPPREAPRYKLILVGDKATPVKTLSVTLPYWESDSSALAPSPNLRGRDAFLRAAKLRGKI